MWRILVLILALSRTGTSRTEALNFLDTEPLRFSIDRERINRNDDEYKGEYGNLPHGLKDFNDFIEEVKKLKYEDDNDDDNDKFKNDINYPPIEKESREVHKIALIEATEENYDNDDDYHNIKNYDNDNEKKNQNKIKETEKKNHQLDKLSNFLENILKEQSIGQWKSPLILIEEPNDPDYLSWIDNNTKELFTINDYQNDDLQTIYPAPWKRSRYYRRYPWKRQNSRSRYDHDSSRYLCTPTREDVFQLLVALHDARQGNKSKTVNFCNRRRPAGSVFTNIRFLGRKK